MLEKFYRNVEQLLFKSLSNEFISQIAKYENPISHPYEHESSLTTAWYYFSIPILITKDSKQLIE